MRYWMVFLVALPGLLSAQGAKDSLILSHSATVLFDSGQDSIRTDADSVLQFVAAQASKGANAYVAITAHTDAVGSVESNKDLSQRRASSVYNRLLALGLKPERLEIKEFGEEKPIADNTTEKGRQANRRATIDIYRKLKIGVIDGRIRDSILNKGIEATVVLKNNVWADSVRTDTSGYYTFLSPIGAIVSLDIFAKGYFLDNKTFKVEPGKKNSQDIKLKKVEVGAAVDLKNFYFVGSQAILITRSEPELPKLLKFMQINSDIKIEIAGHINLPSAAPVTIGSDHYDLSVRRAKLVYDYLIENNIPAERMEFRGYGNWQMRFPRATSNRDQELNRRVEIRILETGLKLGKIGKDGY